MKRTNLNFLIDALAFVAFLLLLSTGMVLQYQLPPGSGDRQGFGSGQGASDRPIELLWSWTRHEWGQVHYWFAILLMGILALHLFLHWKWIVGVIRGKPSNASPCRLAVGCVGFVSVICLTAIPLATTTATVSRSDLPQPQESQPARGDMDSSAASNTDSGPTGDDEEEGNTSLSIRGSMTLEEIAQTSGTPVSKIVAALNLPKDTDPAEKTGRLLREHGLQMSDLRKALGESHSPSEN